MTDPERLLTASDSELERLLLRSGRAAAPPDSRHRALVAATAVLGASALASGGGVAATAAAKTGYALSLKWLTFFGIAGVGAMTAAVAMNDHWLSSAPSRRLGDSTSTLANAPAASIVRPSWPTATVQPPVVVESSAEAASGSPPSPGAPEPSAAIPRGPALVAEPAASSESSVHAELGTLEQARRALSAGEPARALSILDAYSARYPRGSMGPEATVLRVEALVRAGDRSAAARVGNAFLAGNPQSPYATRIRALLGAPNP